MVFDTIKSVYKKNQELITDDSIDRLERARQVINKIVNALTARTEIGSPMAAMYLLGNPDHYTNHSFISLPWRRFVHQVEIDTTCLSPVINYTRHPKEFEDLCVYDWIRLHCSQRIVKTNYDNDNDNNGNLSDVDKHLETLRKAEQTCPVEIPINCSRPLHTHPLYPTHVYHCVHDKSDIVANFIGGTLPRYDKGDQEYYACCMLTLFKPWRTGNDLKNIEDTWNSAFTASSFSDRQLELMRNIQMKHECRDARDDFSLQQSKDSEVMKKMYTPFKNFDEDSANTCDQQQYTDN
ncbi:hypothetical protein BDP27DRAFT_1221593, partial [Rhodocollybia butyracea]